MITLQHFQQESTQVGGAASASTSGVSYGALGFFRSSTPLRPTLDLFPSQIASSLVELDSSHPLPLVKTGAIYYTDTYTGCKSGREEEAKMSRHGKSPKLDLRLNLSPPRVNPAEEESSKQATTTSPPSSCVSSENFESNSPGTTSMMLAGCPRCLMYVMVSEEDPKCPKCKSNVLLDFFPDNSINKSTKGVFGCTHSMGIGILFPLGIAFWVFV